MLEVKICALTDVIPHPDADLIEVGFIGAYQLVLQKGRFRKGDLGAYIPEGAIVPDYIIKDMELEGKLSGSAKNRVKAIKLRGVLSQGLFWHPDELNPPGVPRWTGYLPSGLRVSFAEGENVAEALGITKYEPPIPVELQGKVIPAPTKTPGGFPTMWQSFDVKNWKLYPDVFSPGHLVSITEKLHGSCLILWMRHFVDGLHFAVSSKGLAAKGLALEENDGNAYWRVVKEFGLREKMDDLRRQYKLKELMLFGEVLGVQDLMYGYSKGKLGYRAFDIKLDLYQKPPNHSMLNSYETFLAPTQFYKFCAEVDIPTVPELYSGPFDVATLKALTDGKSTLANHIREGVVIRSNEPYYANEYHPEIGRYILKNVSGDYLLRGKGTEYN